MLNSCISICIAGCIYEIYLITRAEDTKCTLLVKLKLEPSFGLDISSLFLWFLTQFDVSPTFNSNFQKMDFFYIQDNKDKSQIYTNLNI